MTQTQVLYRKYRPSSFAEVVGQDQIIKVLSHTVSTGQPAHAYLFTGSRGTGKTSTARLFAKELNLSEEAYKRFGKSKKDLPIIKKLIEDGQFLDLIEIDAASNRGVNEIRELREKVAFAPSNGIFKVYIIDEVHMLTSEAFNALLKTLEEPPEQTIFMMATTEVHKLPNTILSRVVRFDFQLATDESLRKKLDYICKKENVDISDSGLSLIIKLARGSFRDAESLLEKVIKLSFDSDDQKKGKQVDEYELASILGASLPEEIILLITLLAGKDNDGLSVFPEVESIIDNVFARGTNYQQFVQDFIGEVVQSVQSYYDSPSKSKFNIRKLFKLASSIQDFHSRSEYYIDPVMGIKLTIINFLGSQINSVEENTGANSEKVPVIQQRQRSALVVEQEEIDQHRSVDFVDSTEFDPKEKDTEGIIKSTPVEKTYQSMSKDLKQFLMEIFQQKDRRIAGIIGQSDISREGGNIKVFVPYKFHLQQLDKMENKVLVREVLEDYMSKNNLGELKLLEILQSKTSDIVKSKVNDSDSSKGKKNKAGDNTKVVEDIFAGLM